MLSQQVGEVHLQDKIRQLLQFCQLTVHSQDFETSKPREIRTALVLPAHHSQPVFQNFQT
jgi:hypothetical protein